MSELEWLKRFGDALTDIMEYRNTCQEELADILGVSQATVSRYVNGLQMPSVATIITIANELGCDIDELVNFGSKVSRY